jgi:hypothetical protein
MSVSNRLTRLSVRSPFPTDYADGCSLRNLVRKCAHAHHTMAYRETRREWSNSSPPSQFTRGASICIYWWASESVYMLRRIEYLLPMLGFEPRTIQTVVTKTLCVFRRVQKIFKKLLLASLCLSVCTSVSTHGTNWLPLVGFSWNLIFGYFSKICLIFKFH